MSACSCSCSRPAVIAAAGETTGAEAFCPAASTSHIARRLRFAGAAAAGVDSELRPRSAARSAARSGPAGGGGGGGGGGAAALPPPSLSRAFSRERERLRRLSFFLGERLRLRDAFFSFLSRFSRLGDLWWRQTRRRQTSASWRSGGLSQRQIAPQAAPGSGQPRPSSCRAALDGPMGRGIDRGSGPGAAPLLLLALPPPLAVAVLLLLLLRLRPLLLPAPALAAAVAVLARAALPHVTTSVSPSARTRSRGCLTGEAPRIPSSVHGLSELRGGACAAGRLLTHFASFMNWTRR